MQQFEGMTPTKNKNKIKIIFVPHKTHKLNEIKFFFFVKFLGLCHNNLNQTPGEKFATTSQDLQGFWDMLLLQVDHVDSIFAEIEELKRNNWQVSYNIQLLDMIYFFFFSKL